MADRRKMGTKDMAWTMAVVLVVVALIALYGSQVTFSPSGPAQGKAPTADVIDGFSHARATMDFAVTVPQGIPDSWHPNSFTVSDPTLDGPSALPTVRGGWITPGNAFIMLVESSGDADQVLQAEFGAVRDRQGELDAGGAQWMITTGERTEAAWFRTSGGTTFVITGNAPDVDFHTLADAVAGRS